jgi:hypothetical protein
VTALVQYRAVAPLLRGVHERGPYDLISLCLCESFTTLCVLQILFSPRTQTSPPAPGGLSAHNDHEEGCTCQRECC